jgi:DNA mismatch repair protein MutL
MSPVTTGTAIRVLPPVVANQIAAGEVVTRPSSVVKELVENALDAGARKVRVEIETGGTARVRVVDDGHGMGPEDAALSVQRHATSKIERAEDLLAIRTLGFRGEALPSIASVSRFVLRTRRASDELGTELRIEGGATGVSGPCGCAPGTSVEVADLFFNVPARRKFLRALSTESARVTEVLAAAALACPGIAFVLVRDGRLAREWLDQPSRRERVVQVLGERELVPCLGERGPLGVEAYLSRPERAHPGMGELHFFVNGRPVHDRVLARAVAAAYGPALDRGRYPRGAVFLTLSPDLVDVNVHPQKAEVRFAHARAVGDALCSVVQATIGPMLRLPARPDGAPASDVPFGRRAPPSGPASADPPGAWQWAARTHEPSKAPDRPAAGPSDRYVGTARRWLVFDSPDGLLVVDAVAARVQLAQAQIREELGAGPVPSSPLLFPAVVEAAPAAQRALQAWSSRLAELGFDVRQAGPQEVGLHAVPRALGMVQAELLLARLVRELEGSRATPASAHLDRLLDAVVEPGSLGGGVPHEPAAALGLLGELRRLGLARPTEAKAQGCVWLLPAARLDRSTEGS